MFHHPRLPTRLDLEGHCPARRLILLSDGSLNRGIKLSFETVCGRPHVLFDIMQPCEG